MKRKFSFFLILTGMVFALSACQLLNNGGGGGGYSYRPIGSKSNNDVPPSGDLVAIEPGRTYNDYIKNNVYPLSSTPTVGKANLLVIPIWFNDSATFINQDKKGNVRDDIEKAYFGKNTDTGWRSVKPSTHSRPFGFRLTCAWILITQQSTIIVLKRGLSWLHCRYGWMTP